MKIIHINTHDTSGGAAIATKRLHLAMLRNGIDSTMLVYTRATGRYPAIEICAATNGVFFKFCKHILNLNLRILNKLLSPFAKQINKYKPEYGLFSYAITHGVDISKHPLVLSADVIYLHWINEGFLSLKNIRNILLLDKPVVWFMHDMWPITGGCHHSFECNKYQSQCYACPAFENPICKDSAHKQHNAKLVLFSKFKNISFIAPSKWLANCAKNSMLCKNKSVTHMPNLLDTNISKPLSKQTAKEILNLPLDSKVIAFGANDATNNPYKGWRYLQNALHKIKARNVIVLVFGSLYTEGISKVIPFPVYFLGNLHDDYSLMLAYSAADVLWHRLWQRLSVRPYWKVWLVDLLS